LEELELRTPYIICYSTNPWHWADEKRVPCSRLDPQRSTVEGS